MSDLRYDLSNWVANPPDGDAAQQMLRDWRRADAHQKCALALMAHDLEAMTKKIAALNDLVTALEDQLLDAEVDG
jgi:hypothetical protein